MQAVLLFFFLVAKHVVLSHIVDSGYSDSRDPANRHWWLWSLMNVLSEALVTWTVLAVGLKYREEWVRELMGAEACILLLGCAYERIAPLRRLLFSFILAETVLCLVYALLIGMR